MTEDTLTAELEQRIITFAEQWAIQNYMFDVSEAKAHISRNKQGKPQEEIYDWGDADSGYEVCLDMPGFGDIRTTIVLVNADGTLEIDDSAGGDQGCATCDYGHIREYMSTDEKKASK